jgi:hypothetical protein
MPDRTTHIGGDHMRIWTMSAATAAAYLGATNALAEGPATTTTTTTTETRAAQRERYSASEEPKMRSALIELESGPLAPEYVTPIGVRLLVGGGPTGFLENDARKLTDVGGGWDARVVVGTRSVLGVELGYIGAAQNISAAGLDGDAYLLRTAPRRSLT